ncbi:Nramp transporter, putative [Theobroma cacao]|uniref:Nramp transporter, putative n=1 Tax=Theobroma cacao TaxID=3641 RepID=A0A061DHJ1_THECC|nr:Nramp transporter, putative [Theobroma cacao]
MTSNRQQLPRLLEAAGSYKLQRSAAQLQDLQAYDREDCQTAVTKAVFSYQMQPNLIQLIGTAFALQILFKVPMWVGVLLAGLSTLLLLGLQRYGIRKLEIVIGSLVAVVGGCFFSVMVRASPSAKEIMTGMFVPKLSSDQATKNAIALLGALIVPHKPFLPSALVISRKIPHSFEGIRIRNALGDWSSKPYAISLLASGQSSTTNLKLALLFSPRGFLGMKMELWLRNLITRFIAIAPSLLACIIGGSSGPARLIIIASVTLITWLFVTGINMYFISASFMGWTKNNNRTGDYATSILAGIVVIPIMMLYTTNSVI